MEETGVTVDVDPKIFHVDVHSTPSGHVHYDIRFKAKARDLFLRPYDGESKQIAWWKPGALSNIDDPSMTGAIAKLFA